MTEEIEDYKIVSHHEVNKWIGKGYKLYGNPFSALKISKAFDDSHNEIVEHVSSYKQALVKYKQDNLCQL